MTSGKVMIIDLIDIWKIYSYILMSYFTGPYSRSKNKINVELDLSNYATKSDLKGNKRW